MSRQSDPYAAVSAAFAAGLMDGPTTIVMCLRNRRGTGSSNKLLASRTGMSDHNVAMALRQLENKGMVVRMTPERDRRRVNNYLTEAGKKKADSLWSAASSLAGSRQACMRGNYQTAVSA